MKRKERISFKHFSETLPQFVNYIEDQKTEPQHVNRLMSTWNMQWSWPKNENRKITFEKCYNQYVKIDTFVRGFSIHFTLCHPNAFRVTLKTIRNRGKDRSALLFIWVENRSSVRYKPHTVFRADPLITFQHDRMPEFILVFRVCCRFFFVRETFVVSIFRRIPRKGYGCTRKICKQKVLQRKWQNSRLK